MITVAPADDKTTPATPAQTAMAFLASTGLTQADVDALLAARLSDLAQPWAP